MTQVTIERELLERALSDAEFMRATADHAWDDSDYVRTNKTIEDLRAALQAAPAQPVLHVGNSAFEGWYSEYNAAHKSDKQRARDAYAAGMSDPVAQPVNQVLVDALIEAKRWHQGDKWRESAIESERNAWVRHRDLLDTALAQAQPSVEDPRENPYFQQLALEAKSRF